MTNLPKPDCRLGYTDSQITEIVGDQKPHFNRWISGQTRALCPDHGGIVYTWDLTRYLAGLPILD